MKRLVLVLLAAALSGCLSIRENRLEDGSLAVEIADEGWYVFGFFPIASGNPDGWWPHWFTDDADPYTTMKVLDRVLERERPTVVGPVVTHVKDENVLFLITRISCHTSAVIPRRKSQ